MALFIAILRSEAIFTLALALQPAVLRVHLELSKCLIQSISLWRGPYINLNKAT